MIWEGKKASEAGALCMKGKQGEKQLESSGVGAFSQE